MSKQQSGSQLPGGSSVVGSSGGMSKPHTSNTMSGQEGENAGSDGSKAQGEDTTQTSGGETILYKIFVGTGILKCLIATFF